MQRYFFHSFPRLRTGESRSSQLAKGVRIARSLLDNGLLLTPETYEIPITAKDGTVIDHFKAIQRRACFTELEPSGLPAHSTTFGPFSLAYEIPNLRRIGALPIFYVPLQNGGDYLSGLATELLGGVVDASRLVSQLLAIRKQLSISPMLGLEYRGRSVAFNRENADVIRFFIDTLFDCAAADAEATDSKLRTTASCFYPTENPIYTEPLHYYRQREWRIVGGFFTFNGQAVVHPATPEQVEQLLAIDVSFFSKQLTFYDASLGIGAEVKDSIANRSHLFKRIGDLDVVSLARYLVVPDDMEVEPTLTNAYQERGVEVIIQNEFCRVLNDT